MRVDGRKTGFESCGRMQEALKSRQKVRAKLKQYYDALNDERQEREGI